MSRLFLSDERKWMTCLKEERTARAVYYALEKANVKMAYTSFGMRISVENVKPSMIGI
jgi:hypothetical protein